MIEKECIVFYLEFVQKHDGHRTGTVYRVRTVEEPKLAVGKWLTLKQIVSIVLLGVLGLLLNLFAGSKPVDAQEIPLLPPDPIVVGLYQNPPFVIAGGEGWDGIGIHLWRNAAEELGIDYELLVIAPEETATALLSHKVDLVLGAVANADDEALIDFTHPYYVSTMGTARPAERTILEIAGAFFSPRFWRITIWLIGLYLVVGVVAWLLERHQNEDHFQKGTMAGIWSGFWWAAVTMTTIGYGDKVPRTIGGRILAILWMVVAMGITALLTATLTSILTLRTEVSAANFPGDLRAMNVGAVNGSQSAQFLEEERISFDTYESVEDALSGLRNGPTSIVVDDVAKLRFVNQESFKRTLRVDATGINPQHQAFALAPDSPYREPLNRFILRYTQDPAWQRLVSRYLP